MFNHKKNDTYSSRMYVGVPSVIGRIAVAAFIVAALFLCCRDSEKISDGHAVSTVASCRQIRNGQYSCLLTEFQLPQMAGRWWRSETAQTPEAEFSAAVPWQGTVRFGKIKYLSQLSGSAFLREMRISAISERDGPELRYFGV